MNAGQCISHCQSLRSIEYQSIERSVDSRPEQMPSRQRQPMSLKRDSSLMLGGAMPMGEAACEQLFEAVVGFV
jgi:hypothetical protein